MGHSLERMRGKYKGGMQLPWDWFGKESGKCGLIWRFENVLRIDRTFIS
jgi:hypothetical protein